METKKHSISIVNEMKPIISTMNTIKSKDNIGLLKDVCEKIIKILQEKILAEKKYKKKYEKLKKNENVKSVTMDFFLLVSKIQFLKEVTKETTKSKCTPKMEENIKNSVMLLIKAIKYLITELKKQIRRFRIIFGRTSLLATKDNIECLEDITKKLEEVCSKYIFVMPKGLPNKGNQCYMNSAIQQLYKLKDFREKVLKFSLSPAPEGITDLQRKQIRALQKLFKYLHGDIKLTENQVEDYEKDLGYKNTQEDSSEKMREIMNSFNELIQPSTDPVNEYITDELNIVAENKPIEDLFMNYFIEEKNIKTSFQPYTLKGNSGKFIIYLNRTVFGGTGKNGCKIIIGENLTLKNCDDKLFKFVDNSNKKISNPKLELKGVTIQLGSASGGHYYVYQKSGSQWICKNDRSVGKTTWEDIEDDVCRNATVLVYKLR